MTHHLRHYLSGALLLTAGLSAMAVPAKRQPITVTQPDGSTITILRTGDESRHFTTTTDGLLVKRSTDGFYEYAKLAVDGRLVSTGVRAFEPEVRATLPADVTTAAQARSIRAAMPRPMRSVPQTGLGTYSGYYPTTGDVNALVLLVEYKDVKFNLSDPFDYFNNLLNQEGFSDYQSTGSAKDYFRDNSTGQFRPHFDVYGPITLDKNRAYYGANDDIYGEDIAPDEMVADACKKADADIDFSKYDMDDDGYVDNVYVFYAGEGENNSYEDDAVWPHSWDIQSTLKLDGKYISRYACSNEWWDGAPEGIGTFVHEYGHVLGLPDLYDTVGDLTCTPDYYSVMDMGSYSNDGRTPPYYSAFERNAMGWIDLVPITGPLNASLEHLGDSNHAYIIQTPSTNEFYLLENRQKKGWDKYLPGHGMLIWHIDYNSTIWDNNVVNNSRSHQYVDLVEANNSPNSSSTLNMAGYPWPGTTKQTSFTDDTNPSMRTWSGTRLDLPLTAITETADGLITFKVSGGESSIATPEHNEDIEVGTDYFIASWGAVEGATDYLLTVYEAGESQPETLTLDMGSGKTLSLGTWTASTNSTYATAGNYGEASPSLKLDKDGAWLESPTLPADLTSLSFWHKGMNTDGSTLQVLGLIGSDWKVLATIEPEKNKAATFTLTDIPTGVRKMKLQYSKATGNIGIDDITLTCGTPDIILTGYERRSTAGQTSLRVDIPTTRAEAGRTFRYHVIATDGRVESAPSELREVTLATSGIGGITTDTATTPEWYDLTGRRVLTPRKGDILIERRATTARKLIVR